MRIIYWSSDVCSSDLLKDPAEMARLFRSCPEALTATGDLLACIDFRLDQLEYEYPHEPVPPGWTPQGWLEHLVEEGGRERFSGGLPDSYRTVLDEEFRLIRKKNYASYFLTVHHIELERATCRERGCQSVSISVVAVSLKK